MATSKKPDVKVPVTGMSIAEARARAAQHKEPTLREMYANGIFPIDESVLVELGVTIDEFLETFGGQTHDYFMRGYRSNALDTSQDKVFTNPNLVQGVGTVIGPPGSVQNVEEALQKAEKSRRLLDRMNKSAGISVEAPVWQKAAVAVEAAVTDVPLVKHETTEATSAQSAQPLPAQPAPAPAVQQTHAGGDVVELLKWCESGKKSKGRLVSKSYMLETEIVDLIALLSKEMSESVPFDVNPSSIVRAALRIGLVEQRKKMKGGA